PTGRPPEMSVFNVFFDSPAKRPYQTYLAKLDPRRVRVTSDGRRATIAIGDLSAGPFVGDLEITVYSGGCLVHVEAVLITEEGRRAFLYDAGLAGESPGWRRFVWRDTEGRLQGTDFEPTAADRALAVRHRVVVAETDGGSVACFPPPHQYFFPRDL